MGTRTTDCRKFTPNIFNKSKCSHCFRQREEHSAAALECNRACRKVSKCGYLFVAPDWDFNNPLYRTKRWQRRWFVLYDDGELTYSVDDHAETIPQASVDMTKVLEVSPAEDVTGHTNSIAITAPERVTFVKGTCPEESKWWLNILAAFPKAKGRHKRNATFPGGQATTILQSGCNPANSRNRHNSYHKDTTITTSIAIDGLDSWAGKADDGRTPSSAAQDENNKNAGNELINRVYTDQPVSSKSPPTRDKIHPESKAQARNRNRNRTTPSMQDDSEPVSFLIEDVRRDEKLKDIANSITNLSHNSRWNTTTANNNNNTNNAINSTTTNANNSINSQSSIDEKPTRDETDFHTTVVNLRPKSLPLASNSTPAIVSAIVKKIPPVSTSATTTTAATKSSPRLQQQLRQLHHHHERGDPDGGCTLDELSTNYLSKNSEVRVNLPAEELLNSKKGWLMKQELRTGEWSKHWFTLRGAALFYYRDPVSEERGVLDGVLDVNSLTNVDEITTSRNYAFQLTTWDKRRIVLSSLSANSRASWITVLRSAAGLVDPKPVDKPEPELIIKDNTSDDIKSEIEKDFIKAQRIQDATPLPIKPATTPVTPLTPKTMMFSSDEEYRTASEGGRRDSVDWGSPLSPSPPIPLALFRAKERMRPRSGSSPRLHKRSRSSPPTSRRSTVDSVGSDELPVIHSVQEELNIDKELQYRLGVAEKERDILREEAREREARMSELLTTLERTELELTARIREMEEARDGLSKQLEEANSNAEKVIDHLTLEVDENQKKVKSLEDRLCSGIEENEALYKKLRELEGCSPSSFSNLNRSKMKRMDSLSDLTNLADIDPYCLNRDMLADEYTELKSRFEKAVHEIKAMKKELKESQNEYDNLEISYAALKQDLERKECNDRSQLQMMAERIQDLTLKYSGSERQVRLLKQKLAKAERRRSLSLKGKEQLTVSKELEIKVSELEGKIDDLEKSGPKQAKTSTAARRTANHLRRRSLESSASADSLQFMVRLNDLEKRVESAGTTTTTRVLTPQIDVARSPSSPKMSDHLVERLMCLEGVLVASKDRIEQSLQQLQTLRSSKTRRSVSPITDRKDSYRYVERCLGEVVKLIRDSCESCVVVSDSAPVPVSDGSPIKIALVQLESQLRNKLSDLLKQRRVLRDRNELTHRKDMELLAERIAFESVCFGKLRDSICRAENPALFGKRQTRAEIAETSQLMSMLKAKLSGKCAFKASGSLDVLASVLARRLVLSAYRKDVTIKSPAMEPVDPRVMDELHRQQNELNLIAMRYKATAMESLASGLAAETLSYISSNDLVQGAVQEAWRQAQETVNAELVQSEIAHIMTRNAERFETSVTPSFGYTLTAEERITFESFADAVHDSLRKEMDIAIEQLTRCYDDTLQKMKRGQWRLHLEQERKASEGRQLLSEFADIIAHKALVDARIAVLRGEYATRSAATERSEFSIVALQKYENLFEELANDLQICNPDDILAEADFEFLYRNCAVEFLTDRPLLAEISTSLSTLEQSVIVLQSTVRPQDVVAQSSAAPSLHSLQDICSKCRELRERIESIASVERSCEHCVQMQTNFCALQTQHDQKLLQLQQDYAKEVNSLRKQIENHVNTAKTLEAQRSSLVDELSLQTNRIDARERDLAEVTSRLMAKEEECHRKEVERMETEQQLQNEVGKGKFSSRQDEEYVVLLQERDFIQSELNKERERTRKLDKRLEMLELEHTKQLECLQEAYRDQIMSHCSDFPNIAEEESFRQRYQAEIEQLRTLCEKGLAAMESSHRRIISDLEEKHRKEIERLLIEKEQALAEETQATLAALDAMRKAHQSEVQREVARFKQEFLRQFQKGDHSTDSSHANEEDLEALRQEILSFSAKYSIKCVENAALEEKLRSANQKLKNFQQMQQLELRNKQFRAHLASDDPTTDTNFVQGLTTKGDQPCPDSEHVCDDISTSVVISNTMSNSCVDFGPPSPPPPSLPTSTPPELDSEHNCQFALSYEYKLATNEGLTDALAHQGYIKSPTTRRLRNETTTPTPSGNPLSPSTIQLKRSSLSKKSSSLKLIDNYYDHHSDTEPVEQPKNINLLNPKAIQMKLVNLNLNINNNNNSNNNTYSCNNNHHANNLQKMKLQNKLAISLGSFSDLIHSKSTNYDVRSDSSNLTTPTTIATNTNHQASVDVGNNCNGVRTNRIIVQPITRAAADDTIAFNNYNNRNHHHHHHGDDSMRSKNSTDDCSCDNDNCYNNNIESATVGSNRLCSPPPLSGRDVEHQQTTSASQHLRRFELEI